MLRSDLTAPAKQRHTAVRAVGREASGDRVVVLDAAGVCRRAATGDLGGGRPEVAEGFVQGEVDFAKLWVDLPAGRTKC